MNAHPCSRSASPAALAVAGALLAACFATPSLAQAPAAGADTVQAEQPGGRNASASNSAGLSMEERLDALYAEPLATTDCILLNQIDNTRIVDERHLLFFMRGDRIWLNRLPNDCPGLRERTPYMLDTRINRLCNLDFITVLNRVGSGLMRGASCGLGMFRAVREEDVARLLENDRRR